MQLQKQSVSEAHFTAPHRAWEQEEFEIRINKNLSISKISESKREKMTSEVCSDSDCLAALWKFDHGRLGQ